MSLGPGFYKEGAVNINNQRTGVGYLELEAPKFDASIKFYEQVLGFKILERGGDAQSNKAQATLRMEPILINSPRLGSGARL